ncbi:MAG TPA: M48 family metalloprotease [Solirubrobacteraceae bacterium]|nr:M48 family metalloprotease [Solirubrobacteraceae bacterium]
MKGDSRIRVLAPLLLAVAVADGGARLLTPSDHRRRTAAIDPRDYFTAAEVRRGARYARPQRLLGLARTGVELGVLVGLVRHARARAEARLSADPVADPFEREFGQSLDDVPPDSAQPDVSVLRASAEGAVIGAWLALATTLAPLPLSAIARRRAMKVGLVTQSWRGWGEDLMKATAIESVVAAVGGAGIVALTRLYPRHWWAPAAGASVALGAGFAALAPVLLDPVFNDFAPLDGEVRDDVLALASAAKVKVGGVFSVDASRRTTAANAYVSGLGPTKRVVLYDTLLDRYDRDEVRVVVAHELGHVRHRDVPRGVAFAALVAGPSAFAMQRLSWALEPRQVGGPEALPGLVLAAGLVSAPLGLISSRLSRAIERRADDFSLTLSGAADAFVSFERKICLQNVADVRPPRWLGRVAATHPPSVERIAAAVAAGAGRAERG